MSFAKALELVMKYGPVVRDLYEKVKEGIDEHPEDTSLQKQVQHWLNTASDIFRMASDALGGLMVFGSMQPEMQNKALKQFGALSESLVSEAKNRGIA